MRLNLTDFTKQEIDDIKSKICLTKLQKEIFNLKQEGDLTEDGIALKLVVSKSTIQYQWNKIKKKIYKVI